MAAAYLNKTIAHIEGGDITGSIDESVRHAITKLAHIHFVTNQDAHRRVLAMGEDPQYVFNTGSLDVEVAAQVDGGITSEIVNGYGVGHAIDVSRPFVLVIQHPVTTEADNRAHLEETLAAVSALDVQAIWIWPNPDAGTGEMAESLRHFRENAGRPAPQMRFITDVPVAEFIALLKASACVIGNSSAGIKECSFLGTPVVNIGARQHGRLHAENVVHAAYRRDDILAAVRRQIAHGHYPPSEVYHREGASQSMVDVLAAIPLYTQKRFYENAADAALRTVTP
jgi:UDP-hydrolysing UDP-N-acetyl-D-glucosamine 2-epimerase